MRVRVQVGVDSILKIEWIVKHRAVGNGNKALYQALNLVLDIKLRYMVQVGTSYQPSNISLSFSTDGIRPK